MKRNYLLLGLFFSFVLASVALTPNISIGACGESAPGGRLIRGVITAGIVSSVVGNILSIHSSEGGNVEGFTVQKPEGWYAKVCNEPEMKEHFYTVFNIPGGAGNLNWKCIKVCGSTEQISQRFSNKSGVQKIKMVDSFSCGVGAYNWEVCTYLF